MNRLSSQEETLFEAFIILSFSRKVLEKDLKIIENSHFKIKEPYIDLNYRCIDAISKQLFEIKKQLHSKNIKIQFGANDGTFTEFHCYFRGYVQTKRLLNVHIKNQVQKKLNDFFIPKSKLS